MALDMPWEEAEQVFSPSSAHSQVCSGCAGAILVPMRWFSFITQVNCPHLEGQSDLQTSSVP
jgi:hypothetical protein